MRKKCFSCKKFKPDQDFYFQIKKSKKYFFKQCKKCENLSHKADKEEYYKKNSEYLKAKEIEYNRKRRLEVIFGYGGACECCGENRIEFLCIDHVNGGGTKERKLIGSGHQLYRRLIGAGFPSGYRVLCSNCNMSLGLYGYCPHNG